MAKTKKTEEVQVVKVEHGQVDFAIMGTTPLILNRMSEKAKRELLAPKGRKTAADRASTLKHDPFAEFRASPYTDPNPKGETLIQHLASGFKKGISGAAVDIPGTAKAQVARLVWVMGERISIYGIPKMLMSVTRSADMNKTPDVRTRVILPEWCCYLSVQFAKPLMNETTIANLLVAAGMIQGTGDWRAEKGAGNYGSFEPTTPGNARFKHLVKNCGRKAQIEAMSEPDFYDQETEELYQWFLETVKARGKEELLEHSANGSK